MKIVFIAFFFLISISLTKDRYDRRSFGYMPYKINKTIGFYTQKKCKTNIDHVVSLKDAFKSGAIEWDKEKKNKFSNDKENHVISCYKINSSKGSSTPKNFLRRSQDKKGLDYNIVTFCKYLKIYFNIKIKYDLSFNNNDPNLFSKCSINIEKYKYND